MALVVQKFGGSSVADPEKIRACAVRALEEKERGSDVVVVVSAMGKTTDMLVKLAAECAGAGGASRREMDMLLATGEQVTIALMAMTLESLGQASISFTGQQIGLTTDDVFSKAAIRGISGDRLRAAIAQGKIPVVAGFQGITERGDITTLGRGGSDTTAVAVAAALSADVCEIFTDVDGVYTADPRIVPSAKKIPVISYEAMLEMAALGAKVMHDRSVKLGAIHKAPIHVRHSQRPDMGTMIMNPKAREPGAKGAAMEQVEITGVALKENLGRVTLTSVPDHPGVAARIFAMLAEANIPVDDIIQTVSRDRGATIAFTVEGSDIAEAPRVLERTLASLRAEGVDGGVGGGVQVDSGFSKVSVVGVGIRGHAPAAALMFRTLADAGVNIANITTSEIKISAIIAKADGQKALKLVHEAFGLGR